MRRVWSWIWPSSLKNRLFLSILLLVLVPSFLLQIFNVNRMETMMIHNISSQNAAQLESIKNSFERIRFSVVGAMLQLERDPEIVAYLQHPERFHEEERKFYLKNRLYTMMQTLGSDSNMPVHLLLADQAGHTYSTLPDIYDSSPMLRQMLMDKGQMLDKKNQPYSWEIHQTEEPFTAVFEHPVIYSNLSRLESRDGQFIAYLRISLDVNAWLSAVTNNFQVKQNYYVLDASGNQVNLTASHIDSAKQLEQMLTGFRLQPDSYVKDASGMYLYNGIYMPNTGWYLISRFPLEALSGNIKSMLKDIMFVLGGFSLLFIAITFGLVATLVKPLRHLQKQMSQLVDRNLEVRLPEHKYRGEVLTLAKAFNKMIQDIQELIKRLRSEERQREASRFQMLMAQMNPHFLLNTLNTIKWNARNHGDADTSEICQNLGMILEHSLNSEVDLVHLREEISLIQAYMHIQSFRYEHSFESVYELEQGLDYVLVPKLSLQPLVENAIHHGLVHMKENGKIMVRAAKCGQMLLLEVQDNGCGLQQENRSRRTRKGIGLSNLRERLALLYRQEASLQLIGLEQGTLARMEIPLLDALPYGEGHIDVENTAG
ncbi:sensor histidine kinase [Paenibacillus sanguinis]|uniref:sensor histidine kinase n=1 Tax=Paenibacillus sanguinis TaxID=225906 RepID=UPI0003764CB6|nr:histidine kinase [Paenibacillus sanguinis]